VSSDNEVRTARWHLGKLLSASPDGLAEARSQFDRALTEPGQDPPDWRILGELCRLERAAGDSRAGLRHSLLAISTAPLTEVEYLAVEGLALLADIEPEATGAISADIDLDDLARRASAPESPEALVMLTTALIRMEDSKALQSLLRARPAEAGTVREGYRGLATFAQVLQLMDHDEWSAALEAFEREGFAGDPSYAEVQGLVLYAGGRVDEAWDCVERARGQRSVDRLALRALILLHRAAAVMGDERRQLIEQALNSALEAAQIEPTRTDVSLLRAEITLEGGLDLDVGRKLLRGALRKLGTGLASTRWWRAQERLRSDEVYSYFRVEVAAARNEDVEVLERVAKAGTNSTDLVQDAAMAELEARARVRRGQKDDAAAAYQRAARSFLRADMRSRAIAAYDEAVGLGASVGTVLALVELLYEASFAVDDGGEGDASAVGRGLSRLDAADEVVAGADAVRSCFLTGMLLLRGAPDRAGPAAAWPSLPHLLVATLAEDDHYYRPTQLAWALHSVNLIRPAEYFAELGLSRSADLNGWLADTAVVMRFNWEGALDERAEHLMTSMPDPKRNEALRALGYLLAGDRARLCATAAGLTDNGLWARQVQAHATARCGSFQESLPQFVSLLEDAISADNTDVAVDAALVLGNVETAREQLKENERTGVMNLHFASLWQAVIDLSQGIQGSAQRAAGLVEEAFWPFELRSLARMHLPTLVDAWPDAPDVQDVLLTLAHQCDAVLGRLEKRPQLTRELDVGHVSCPDPELGAAVWTFLDATQKLRDGDRDAAAQVLRGLVYRPERSPSSFHQALQVTLRRLTEPTETD